MTLLTVVVDPPRIEGDTVFFSWTQSQENPFQTDNAFFYRYEGLDLTRFSTELFYEIFLSLQLRVFAAHRGPVEVHFPTPVPAFSAAYWLAYGDITNIAIEPIDQAGTYSPWSGEPYAVTQTRKAAVFFGGGKDSTLATCLLSEIYGVDEVLVLQFVGPLRNDPKLTRFLEVRQENLMLKPARVGLGVATQRGWTNYQAIFRKAGYGLRPHLELYTVGGLPALLAWGVQVCTLGTPWTLMNIESGPTGKLRYHYAQSRPEMLDAQSRHYAATLGQPITVTDVILPFHSLAAHSMLAQRYPAALRHIASCTIAEPDVRWCHGCTKCALFAIMSLATGTFAPDFDYEFFLTKSSVIHKLIRFAETGVEFTDLGNAPWAPGFFSAPQGFILGCHMVAQIDPDVLSLDLSNEARGNLAIWCAMYGNHRYPEWETVPRSTLETLPLDLRQRITAIVAEHFEIIDGMPQPCYAGNEPTHYQFDTPLELAVTKLAHIAQK